MRLAKIVIAVGLCLFTSNSRAEEKNIGVLHKFQLWGIFQNYLQKESFLHGWTNGFFAGPRSQSFLTLANCMEDKLTNEQAIAMIDKYYAANPERWDLPLSSEIVSALTVRSGPCADIDPWRRNETTKQVK